MILAQDAPLQFEFIRKNKLKRLVAFMLLMTFGLYVGCGISFLAIGLISSAIGLLNSMGVFGDGELSEILGYVSIIGSVVGFAGNMMCPGGGIGSGYGADGFGIGAPTESYATAAGAQAAANANTGAPGSESTAQVDKVAGTPSGTETSVFDTAPGSENLTEATYSWSEPTTELGNVKWDGGGASNTFTNPDGSVIISRGTIDGIPTQMTVNNGVTSYTQYTHTEGFVPVGGS